MRSVAWLLIVCSAAFATFAYGQGKHLHLGRSLPVEEERRWNITVLPDGTGLPVGSGTVSQGKKVYLGKCSGCHGENGEGREPLGGRLVGGIGTLKSSSPVVTIGSYWPYATTVWDYIYRAMPYPEPSSLSPDETYAVTAFLLYRNGIIRRDIILSRKTLPDVKMPNRDGFIPDPRPDVKP